MGQVPHVRHGAHAPLALLAQPEGYPQVLQALQVHLLLVELALEHVFPLLQHFGHFLLGAVVDAFFDLPHRKAHVLHAEALQHKAGVPDIIVAVAVLLHPGVKDAFFLIKLEKMR